MAMAEITRVSTDEAKRLIDDGYTYVDVRTAAEYAAGHPRGAYNVPVLTSVGGRMTPNPEFVRVIAALFPSDARLVVGCAAGKRSLTAVRQLQAAGFSGLVELRPGYSGLRDPFGQVTEEGWAAAGLPTELTTPGASYDEILAKIAE